MKCVGMISSFLLKPGNNSSMRSIDKNAVKFYILKKSWRAIDVLRRTYDMNYCS